MHYVALAGPAFLLVQILNGILEAYLWVVIAAVVMSWLLTFNVVNYHNEFVRTVVRILTALTEPVFRLIRRILPPIGGLDLSPLVVFAVIWVLQVFAVPVLGAVLSTMIG
jgi:YggT family protein